MLRFSPQHNYQHLDTTSTTSPVKRKPVAHVQPHISKFNNHSPDGLGKPAAKPQIDTLDLLAIITSLACLSCGIVITDPRLPYAFKLGQNNQIIVLGFLLGIMNQCLLRVFPYFLVLLESRVGRSTLQNYEGILRWSPWSNRLNPIWRSLLILLIAMPLVLSVLYKRSIGGFASTHVSSDHRSYTPTGPPGLQGYIKANTIMANATAPLLASLTDDKSFPADMFPQGFGFNILILSNTSAAAIDAPTPERVTELQTKLSPGSSVLLTAPVRGTVAQYNQTTGNRQYWDQTSPGWSVDFYDMWVSGSGFGISQAGFAGSGDAWAWNGSWVLAAAFNVLPIKNNWSNKTLVAEVFLKSAMKFDVKRHNCTATWQITRSSIELINGDCNMKKLAARYQYFDNCELGLSAQLGRSLTDNLGLFATSRNQSHWRVTTYSAVLASAYQSIFAAGNFNNAKRGSIHLQPADSFSKIIDKDGDYVEIYNSTEELVFTRNTLKASSGLVAIIALQPFITVVAFLAVLFMFSSPIGRNFGLVSVMAGIDRNTLWLLSGAAFSGDTSEPIGISVTVLSDRDGDEPDRIVYRLGESGTNGKVQQKRVYQ